MTALRCDEVNPTGFHARLAVAGAGGVFADGYGLGIIGIALANAAGSFSIGPLTAGVLGGAALAGLFLGALLTGPVADRRGRRPVFAVNMAVLLVLSLLQVCVQTMTELAVLRLLIGIVLGTDYVVSKAMLAEWMPARIRAGVLAGLAVAWAAGYAAAYFVGFAIERRWPGGWQWMLATSALPCVLVGPLRLSVPESPVWLLARGREADARAAVRAALGPQIGLPRMPPLLSNARWRSLLAPGLRVRTLVASTVFICQVIPYFALGTFIARVLAALGIEAPTAAGVTYNLSLLGGAVLGLVLVDRMPRRRFLIGSFTLAALAMSVLTIDVAWPRFVVVGCVALFAAVVSGASNILYVYLPELFPPAVRASGIGFAIAVSRIGSALATFLLPVVVADLGVRPALGLCVAVLALGGIVCLLYAPETRPA